jgi:hypothetical protein
VLTQPIIVLYPTNPRCHGNMLYEATIPNLTKPERLVYRCPSCRGQAIQDVIGGMPTHRKNGKFYTPKPGSLALLAESEETAEDALDVLPDTES